MKKAFTIVLAIFACSAHSQGVAINAYNLPADSSSVLDVSSSSKGVLLTRVLLTCSADSLTVLKPAPYLIVYNTSISTSNGLTGAGLYANIGTKVAPNWQRIGVGSSGLASPGLKIADSTRGNLLHLSLYGDSFSESPMPLFLGKFLGRPVSGQGVTGETSTQIRARFMRDSSNFKKSNIIWAGRNNYITPSIVQADIAGMVSAISNDAYVIVGVPIGAYTRERSGSANYASITALNSALAVTYGAHYVDPNALVLPLGSSSGIDSVFRSYGQTPESLRNIGDSLHYNEKAHFVVAQAIANTLKNFIDTGAIVTIATKISSDGINPSETYALDYSNVGLGGSTLRFANMTKVIAYNTAIGIEALMKDSAGSYNTSIGAYSGRGLLAGNFNTFGGFNAGSIAMGSNISAWGANSAYKVTGSNHAFVGGDAARGLTSGNNDVAIGYRALGNANTHTISNTVAVGYQTMINSTTGADANIAIGYQAMLNNTTGTRNIVISYQGDLPNNTGNGQGNLGNVIWWSGASSLSGATAGGQVAIGVNTPATSALLELSSTSKGLLLPRMTKVQRDAIPSPAAGLAIFQTDNTPGLRVYNGTNWVKYAETID